MTILFKNEQILSLEEASNIISKLYKTNPEMFSKLPKFNLSKHVDEIKEQNLTIISKMTNGLGLNAYS